MVTLVGAGPGGRELLTVAGEEAIRRAEVAVYDRLVSEDILELLPEHAERINVGKESSHHPVPQPEINEILARHAKSGKNVVRIKGGDCYLFGRGGEECEYLLEQGVPFRIIPGVTSALAVPAFAGIPVTHRDFCSSVHIVTAHAKKNAPLEIDYERLVKLRGTLVFLMGVTALREICEGLLNAGIAPALPAAVIENGARPQQRKLVSTVAELPEAAREMRLKSPAVIVVGKVCSLSGRLDWFTPLPLHGKTLVVTRLKARAGTLAVRLRALGAEVLECPCIETVLRKDLSPLEQALARPHDWAVFTSPTGVELAVRALRAVGRDLRALYGMRLAAVGRGTAEALEKYGLTADLIPERYDGVHLAGALQKELPSGGAVLLLRASAGGAELPAHLRNAGITVSDIAVYDTVFRAENQEGLRARLSEKEVDAAVFASGSAVRGFARIAEGCDLSALPAICIGAQTAAVAEQHHMTVHTAKAATIDGLVDCALEVFAKGDIK